MDYGIVVCSSITAANRVKKLAEQQLSHISVMQIPASLNIRGCNYSVRCKFLDLDRLLGIFEQSGQKAKAIFKESMEDGKKVYIRL